MLRCPNGHLKQVDAQASFVPPGEHSPETCQASCAQGCDGSDKIVELIWRVLGQEYAS